ncbi:hypothetical protein [Brucella tritici]|uniref:hypothetical protein n=1 Tax=Brucella tritici TaxID=94626 RepID=UPI00200084C9|nr:hypothetical protein [Brucella tritici]
MRTFFYIGVAAILASSTALAENGDVLKCTVSNFTNNSNEGTTDKNFVEANMQKVFDIIESKQSFIVVGRSKEIKPYTTDFKLLKDGVLGAFAIADSIVGLETLAVSRSAGKNEPVTASISLQSSNSINSWFLTCAKLN